MFPYRISWPRIESPKTYGLESIFFWLVLFLLIFDACSIRHYRVFFESEIADLRVWHCLSSLSDSMHSLCKGRSRQDMPEIQAKPKTRDSWNIAKARGPFDPQLKVSKFQNEFMKSPFLPKYEQKIVKISALTTQGRNPDNFLFVFWEKRWLHKFILKLSDL